MNDSYSSRPATTRLPDPSGLRTDLHVRKLRLLDRQRITKEKAAARAGIDPKTTRKYWQLGRLPSEVKLMARDWRTIPDPFVAVWPQLEEMLDLNPGLEAKTLF